NSATPTPPPPADQSATTVGPSSDSIAQADTHDQPITNDVSGDFVETSSIEKGLPLEEVTTPEKDAIHDIVDLENQALSDDQQLQQSEQPLPRNAGFLRSFSNVVCIIIGTGCLQIPYAFAKTGWIGVVVIILSAFIGSYTGVLTIRCLYYQPGKRLHSFPQIGRAAFGPWGQYIT
ncbi:hypothetical protein LPJ59_006245, partial [Coemansia sp. RSA 2399]